MENLAGFSISAPPFVEMHFLLSVNVPAASEDADVS
jgi:hypothetical protein